MAKTFVVDVVNFSCGKNKYEVRYKKPYVFVKDVTMNNEIMIPISEAEAKDIADEILHMVTRRREVNNG